MAGSKIVSKNVDDDEHSTVFDPPQRKNRDYE